MVHSQTPESMRVDQEFPVSIEAQLLGGNGSDERSTGNVCTPGTHIVMEGELIQRHCIDSRSKTYHGDRWVVFEMEVYGDERIVHLVEGKVVLQYERPQFDLEDAAARRLTADGTYPLTSGYIALQAESHPVEFRKIELLPLE